MRTETLKGKKIAMLLTDGVEEVEYLKPRQFLEKQSATVELLSPKAKGEQIQGFNHLTPDQSFRVEVSVKGASPADYDALVLPGGVANPDMLRLSREAVNFVREMGQAGKPIAAICHGPWMLVEAGLVKGKHLTSWPSLQTDLKNAGADWRDEPVVVDGVLVTSRKPDDIPAFNEQMLKVFSTVH